MKFAETYRDNFRSVGHWLFLPGSISAFHRLTNCEEIWAIHIGRLSLHMIDSSGGYERVRLGTDVAAGEVPLVTVPRGGWQAAELPTLQAFAFGTNVCAPVFDYSTCEMGSREQLIRSFPQHKELIGRLTHDHQPSV